MLLLCAGCALRVVPPPTPLTPPPERVEAPPPVPTPAELVKDAEAAPPPEEQVAEIASEQDAADAADADGDDEAGAADAEDGESHEATGAEPSGPLYTADLTEQRLEELWKKDPSALGSVSVGFTDSGRLVNGRRFPEGQDWLVVSPEKAWATDETIDYLTKVIREVRERYPDAPLLRVNQISAREGGYLRPHKSHQNGRDVDLGFYYPTVDPVRASEREKYIDVRLNWALLRTLISDSDVQLILVDRRVQKVLYDYALKTGEDKAWLDSVFHAGERSIVKHARRHRDHFHVRFFNPRAQELGRRLAPLLALQPEHNIAMHRVRLGDTLGAIALRYGASLEAIRKVNRVRGHMLQIGQVLSVPLRGPCTRCPVPPPVVVPPRRVPTEQLKAAATASEQQAALQPVAPPASEEPAGGASGEGEVGLSTAR